MGLLATRIQKCIPIAIGIAQRILITVILIGCIKRATLISTEGFDTLRPQKSAVALTLGQNNQKLSSLSIWFTQAVSKR
jgi:hypothetical protein